MRKFFSVTSDRYDNERPPFCELEIEEDKSCEYCDGGGNNPLDWAYGLDHILANYRYCPMCGRKLKKSEAGK